MSEYASYDLICLIGKVWCRRLAPGVGDIMLNGALPLPDAVADPAIAVGQVGHYQGRMNPLPSLPTLFLPSAGQTVLWGSSGRNAQAAHDHSVQDRAARVTAGHPWQGDCHQ